jgi:hypothetical protein
VVARAQAPGFVPSARPRVAVASDGTMAAICEPTRITVVELPGGAAFAELGVDPDASASDIAWVGAPPRLLVVSRYTAHSTAHLVDPYGPRTVAEIRLEAPMKLAASVGAHALAVGALGAAVLAASDSHVTPYQFPARAVPTVAGAAGSQFVVALAGAIEEWDPQSRIPKRRIKLPKPAVLTAVGGSDRVVWWTSQADPTRVEVHALVNRGQPKVHQLPEPIAHVAAHPRSDLLACVGADSGRIYVVDLDGRATVRAVAVDGIDRVEAAALVVGRMVGVLAAQGKRAIAVVSIDAREHEPAGGAPTGSAAPAAVAGSTLFGEEGEAGRRAVAATAAAPAAVTASAAAPVAVAVAVAVTDTAAAPVAVTDTASAPARASASAVPIAELSRSLSDRFATWRDRTREAQPRVSDATQLMWREERPSWRDELVGWVRAALAGTGERERPSVAALDTLAVRCELPPQLVPALALLYGIHLAGEPGAAPFDVARVLGRRWDEALGRGELARRGLTVHAESRVRLAPVVLRALDELAPRTGTLVGTAGAVAVSLLGPCVTVAPASEPLGLVASAQLPALGGAILAHDGVADPAELALEARVHGAVPMTRVIAALRDGEPMIAVVADEEAAERLGFPRLR